MSSYVQLFLGPADMPESQVIADVEAATGLVLAPRDGPRRAYWGSQDGRAVLLDTDQVDYDDEPHLPSFAEHPYELEFYTAESTIESERRFLNETFRRLRETGRYTLFATKDVHVRIDPD